MPSFDIAPKLCTGVEDTVIPVLVVSRSCYTVAEHAFLEMRQGFDWILLEEPGGVGGIALRPRLVWIFWDSEGVELILGYACAEVPLASDITQRWR